MVRAIANTAYKEFISDTVFECNHKFLDVHRLELISGLDKFRASAI